jgi:outer membrane protein TolC
MGLVLAAMVPLMASAQPTNGNARSLSLRDCLNLALTHNVDVQINRYTPQIAEYNLKAGYGAYDPVLELTAKHSFVDQPAQFNPKKWVPNSTAALGPGIAKTVRVDSEYELTTDTVKPELTGRLPTGLSYDLFARADHLDAKTFPSVLDQADISMNAPALIPFLIPALTNDYYATVGLTLKQPLLKDFWIDRSREAIQLNKKNLQITELALRGHLMSIVTAVSSAYYNLIDAREHINVQQQALQLAQQLLADTHKKVQAGTMTPLDEKQAEADIETVRTALFGAEQTYTEDENLLKNLLTDNYQSWMDVRIVPSENLEVADLPANRSVSWVNALSKRPDIQEMRINLEKQDIITRFTYNQLFPSFDLVGSYGWQAVQHRFSDSWNDIGEGANPFYSVGVVVSFPLGNRTARNEYQASKLAKQQAFLQYKKLEQGVITEVDTAVKLAETTYKQITSTRKAREFAQAALEVEQTKYVNGTSTSLLVQQSQRNLTQARSAEIRALTDYNIALSRLALSEGTTLERNQINVKTK